MKTFKDIKNEMMTTGDAGIPQDTANMGRKKNKPKVLTRNYIEIMGKRKKLVK
jgi:hypothetical protein